MTNSSKSLLVFGVYLLVVGSGLMVAPNDFLAVFGNPPTTEIWIRVMGMLLLYLGIYNIAAGKGSWSGFIALSVPIRMSVILFFAAFVVLLGASKTLLLFGATDFAFAVWTWSALAKERRQA